jgi:hypothetical protein
VGTIGTGPLDRIEAELGPIISHNYLCGTAPIVPYNEEAHTAYGRFRSLELTELGKHWVQSLTMTTRRLLSSEEAQTAAVGPTSCGGEVTNRRHSAFYQDV